MQIHVYDTYVKSKDGHTMHFDVFTGVKDDEKRLSTLNNGWFQSTKAMQQFRARNADFVTARARPTTLSNQLTKTVISSTRWRVVNNRILALLY